MDKLQVLKDEIINYNLLVESCDYEINNLDAAMAKIDNEHPNDPVMADYKVTLTEKKTHFTNEKRRAQLMLDTLNEQLQNWPQ